MVPQQAGVNLGARLAATEAQRLLAVQQVAQLAGKALSAATALACAVGWPCLADRAPGWGVSMPFATTTRLRTTGWPGLADHLPGGGVSRLQLEWAAGAMGQAAVLQTQCSPSAQDTDSHLRLLAELVATTTKLAHTLPPDPPDSLVSTLPLALFVVPCAAIQGITGAGERLGAEFWTPSACR